MADVFFFTSSFLPSFFIFGLFGLLAVLVIRLIVDVIGQILDAIPFL